MRHVFTIINQGKSSSVGGIGACAGYSWLCGGILLVFVFIVISHLGRLEGVINITLMRMIIIRSQSAVLASRGRVNGRWWGIRNVQIRSDHRRQVEGVPNQLVRPQRRGRWHMLCRFDVLIVRLHLQAVIAIVRSVVLLLVAHNRLVVVNSAVSSQYDAVWFLLFMVRCWWMDRMPTAVDEIQKAIERL